MDKDIHNNKSEKISKQIDLWDILARLVPTLFLVIISILYFLDLILIKTAFYIGIGGFAITAVTWWFWVIVTIRYLIKTLNRASSNLRKVNQDVIELAKDIEDLKNE